MMHPTKTPAAATRLRRSSTPLPRIRSSSFSSHTSIYRNTREARIRSTSICLYHKPTSSIPSPNTPIILTRRRSTWLSHPRPNTIFGFRLSSTFHDPKCKWIHSSDGPHASPRDKECPACQEAEKQPEQLSPQELWWERRMHRFREAVDRDPYDAMFGWSNDMLKGKPLKARWFWDEVSEGNGRAMWSLRAIRESAAKNHERWRLQMGSRGRDAEERPLEPAPVPSIDPKLSNKKVKVEATKPKEIPVEKSQPQPEIQAFSQWSWQSTDSAGKSVARSGASTYDPVSGRMVPIKQDIFPEDANLKSSSHKTPSGNISIPVKHETSPEDAAPKSSSHKAPSGNVAKEKKTVNETMMSEIKEKVEFITWLSEHPEELEDSQKAATSHVVEPAQHTEKSESSQSPVSANADGASERGQLYEKTERSLVTTQEFLRALIATDPVRQKFAVRTEDRARGKPLGKTLLCLRNTQLSLESYSASVKALARLNHTSTIEDEATSEMIHKKRKMESSWRKDEKRPASARDPHFKQRDSKYPLKDYAADVAARQAYESLHRHRNAPLKYMNSHELQNHRSLLLRSWKKQHPQAQPSQSEAQKRLSQEVDAQKKMYAAWENRWSRKTPLSSSASASAPAPPSSEKATQSVSDLAPQQAAPAIAAEGDMCPNVAKFCNAERVYKRKAPHAMMDDEPALVQKIKSIYEETYGTIDVNHRQRRLDQETFDTTRSSLWRESTRPSIHDRHAPVVEPGRSRTTTHAVSPLITSLQRHRALRKASPDAKTSPFGSESTSEIQPTTRSSPYVVVEYNESKLSLITKPVASHPDGWSSARSSPNTIMENLRAKTGYSAIILPQIQKLREQGYVVWDLARDDKTIIFKLQTPMNVMTAQRIVPSMTKPTTISASSNIPKGPMTNAVDASLRSSPPQTQTGNFASPTGFVNLDRPNEPVAPQMSAHNAEAALQEKTKPTTMFEMLDAHASQAVEQTPEHVRQQRKEFNQILRQQQYEQHQQQEPDVPRAACAKAKNSVKRQERVYSGGRQKGGPQKDDRESWDTKELCVVLFVAAMPLVAATAVVIWKFCQLREEYRAVNPALKPEKRKADRAAAALGGIDTTISPSAAVTSPESQMSQMELAAKISKTFFEKQIAAYEAELNICFNRLIMLDQTATKKATAEKVMGLEYAYERYASQAWFNEQFETIERKVRHVEQERASLLETAAQHLTEPEIYRAEKLAWCLKEFDEIQASLARRRKKVKTTQATTQPIGNIPKNVKSAFWQDEKLPLREMQERKTGQKAELSHPVAVAFVEAATLSLSLGAVGWIFLRMLGQ